MMLLATPVLAATIGVYLVLEGENDGAVVLFLMAGATLFLTLSLTFPCRYTVTQDSLIVRCGLIGYRVPLNEIECVEPVFTFQSGPALSMRRVAVQTNTRKLILSPRDRDAFVEDLRRTVDQNSPTDDQLQDDSA